jgi:hypothetical protein
MIMKIHTSLSQESIYRAARLAGVDFERLNEHGSRSHPHAFDVILSGSGTTGGQWGNSGKDGAAPYKAATWDEWGIFLAAVFGADETAKATYYESADDFHWQTGGRFRMLRRDSQHLRHKWSFQGECVTGAYWVHECKCGAVKRMGNPRH